MNRFLAVAASVALLSCAVQGLAQEAPKVDVAKGKPMANSVLWGTVTGIAVTPVAIAAGLAQGTYDSASANRG